VGRKKLFPTQCPALISLPPTHPSVFPGVNGVFVCLLHHVVEQTKYVRPSPVVAYAPGDGFDVYIDGARYLPPQTIACRVSAKIMDRAYVQYGAPVEELAALDNEATCPRFTVRYQLWVCLCIFMPLSPYILLSATVRACLAVPCRLEGRNPAPPTSTLLVRLDVLSDHSPDIQVRHRPGRGCGKQ
jgi:hypothetical protein